MTRKMTSLDQEATLGPQEPAPEQTTGDTAASLPAYEVGYGRPPVRTRFKPGQSGNPRGRPKGARNIETILRETLFAPITIVDKGRRKKVPRIEALSRRLMDKGLSGDLRATLKMIEIAERLGFGKDETVGNSDLSSDEEDLLDVLSARARRLTENKGGAGGGDQNGGGDHE